MNEQNMQRLWSSLGQLDSNFTRTFDEFQQDMQDEGKRRRLHSSLGKLDPKFTRTYEEFSQDMGFTSAQENIQQARETAQQAVVQTNNQQQQGLEFENIVRPQDYEGEQSFYNLSNDELQLQIANYNTEREQKREAKRKEIEKRDNSFFGRLRDAMSAGQTGDYQLAHQRDEMEVEAVTLTPQEEERFRRLTQEQAYRRQGEGSEYKQLGQSIVDAQNRLNAIRERDGKNIDTGGADAYLDKAMKLYTAPSMYGNSNGFKNWAVGLGDQLSDYDTWTAGVTEMSRAINLNSIVDKLNKKEELTDREEAELEAFLLYGAVQDARQYDLSTGYTVGKGTAESIPFMVEMFLTAGAGAAAKRGIIEVARRSGNKMLAERIARAFGEKITGETTKKILGKDVRRATLEKVEQGVVERVGRQIGEDVLMTAFMPTTWASVNEDAIDKKLSGEDYGFGDFMRTFAGSTIETGTEHWGGKIVDKALGKVMPLDKIWGKTRWGKLLTNDFIQSPLGETGEEYVGAIANYIRSYDPFYSDKSNEQLRQEARQMFSIDGFTQTFLTVLPMSVLGGAVNVGVAKHNISQYQKSKADVISLLQQSGATEEQAANIVLQIEGAENSQGFSEKIAQTIKTLNLQYLEQHPDATEEDAKKYFKQIDKILGKYFQSAAFLNELSGELTTAYNGLTDEQKQQVQKDFYNAIEQQAQEADERIKALMQAKREKQEQPTESTQTAEPAQVEEKVEPTQTPTPTPTPASAQQPTATEEKKSDKPQRIELRTMQVIVDGAPVNVNIGGSAVIEEDGSIDFTNPQNRRLYLTDSEGKPLGSSITPAVQEAINEQLRQGKQQNNQPAQEQAVVETADETPTVQEQLQALGEQQTEPLTPEAQQAVAEQAEEQRVQGVFEEVSAQVGQKGSSALRSLTPEQKFIWSWRKDGGSLEKAIANAKAHIEEAQKIKDIEEREYEQEQWQRLIDKYSQQAPISEETTSPIASVQPTEAPAQQPEVPAQETVEPTPQQPAKTVEQAPVVEEEKPNNEEKVDEDLEEQQKSSNFASVGGHLQVNITQNAGDDSGKPNRADKWYKKLFDKFRKKGWNEKDRTAYNQALQTLRSEDSSAEDKAKATATIDEIEKRRKVQMNALVSEALRGIDGVSNVQVNGGIGVYVIPSDQQSGKEKGVEVIEYTFTIDADVTQESEEAFRAAMAAIAEATKQDSFIVNYTDETEAQQGKHEKSAQVYAKLKRPLTATEKAELTALFSEFGQGVTITDTEIMASNFSETNPLATDEFCALATFLIENYSNGTPTTTLLHRGRTSAIDKFRTLEGVQIQNGGSGVSVRGILSNSPILRYNYSTYYAARESNNTTGERSNYWYYEWDDNGSHPKYPAYTAIEGRVPNTNILVSDLQQRLENVYVETEASPDGSASATVSLEDDDIAILLHPVKNHYPLVKVARVVEEDGKRVYREIGTDKILSTDKGFWSEMEKEVVEQDGKQYVLINNGEASSKRRAIAVNSTEAQLAEINRLNISNNSGLKGLIELTKPKAQTEQVNNASPYPADDMLKTPLIKGQKITIKDILTLHGDMRKNKNDIMVAYTVYEQIQDMCEKMAREKCAQTIGVDENGKPKYTEEQVADMKKQYVEDIIGGLRKFSSNWNTLVKQSSLNELLKEKAVLDFIDPQLIEAYWQLQKVIFGKEQTDGDIPSLIFNPNGWSIKGTNWYNVKKKSKANPLGMDANMIRYIQIVASIAREVQDFVEGTDNENNLFDLNQRLNLPWQVTREAIDENRQQEDNKTQHSTLIEKVRNAANDKELTSISQNLPDRYYIRQYIEYTGSGAHNASVGTTDRLMPDDVREFWREMDAKARQLGYASFVDVKDAHHIEHKASAMAVNVGDGRTGEDNPKLAKETAEDDYADERKRIAEEGSKTEYERKQIEQQIAELEKQNERKIEQALVARERGNTELADFIQSQQREIAQQLYALRKQLGIEYSIDEEQKQTAQRKAQGERTVEVLRKAGANISIIDEADINSIVGEGTVRELKDKGGVVYGFTDGKQIWVVSERINPNTPIHEHTHLWVATFAQLQPKKWAEIVEVLKQTPEWQAIMENDNYADIRGDEQAVASEAMARLTGEYWSDSFWGHTRLDDSIEQKTLSVRVRTAFRAFWEQVCNWLDQKINRRDKEFEDKLQYILQMPMGQIIADFAESENSVTFAPMKRTPIEDVTLDNIEQLANDISNGKLLFERFSPQEQRGFTKGGRRHVVASLLAGRSNSASPAYQERDDFKRERQLGAAQEKRIEEWSKQDGCWYDNADRQLQEQYGKPIAEGGEAVVHFDPSTGKAVKSIRLDYYVSPQLALDRITLHNTLFPETALEVLGFGRDSDGNFCIIAEQPFVKGERMTEKEIQEYVEKLGFRLTEPRSWTYSNGDIYLSDLHDENVLRDKDGNIIVIDADIRLNDKDNEMLRRHGATREVNQEAGLVATEQANLTEEEQSIIERAQKDGTFMLAPNGSPTNLNEKQWLQVRTEAFKQWFGDWEKGEGSRVLDENGEPKVVYRGSKNANSFIFHSMYDDGSFWFTDNKQVAEHYARKAADHELTQEELDERGQPVFLNVRETTEYDAGGRNWEHISEQPIYSVSDDEGNTRNFSTREEAEAYCREQGLDPEVDIEENNGVSGYLAQEQLQQGKDGVIFQNMIDGSARDNSDTPATIYVTKENAQAKSATLNNGEFDNDNPDIRFHIDGEEGALLDDNEPLLPAKRMSWLQQKVNAWADQANGIRLLQKQIGQIEGKKVSMAKDVREALEAKRSKIANTLTRFYNHQNKHLGESLRAVQKSIKKSGLWKRGTYDYYVNSDGVYAERKVSLINVIEMYLMAKDTLERISQDKEVRSPELAFRLLQHLGLSTKTEIETKEQQAAILQQWVKKFESTIPTQQIDALWKSVNECTNFTLDVLKEGGLLGEIVYNDLKKSHFYVPERGFAQLESDEDVRNEVMGKKSGLKNRVKPEALRAAHGGESMATDVIANLLNIAADAVMCAEENKVRQAAFNLLKEHPDACRRLGYPAAKQVWYVRDGFNEDGTPRYKAQIEQPSKEMIERNKEVKELIRGYREDLELFKGNKAMQDHIRELIKDAERELLIVTRRNAGGAAVDRAGLAGEDIPKVLVTMPTENGDTQQYTMVFPNQREVANALNGVLSTKFSDSLIKSVGRFFSSMFTTYNPLFWSRNLPKDALFVLQKGTAERGLGYGAFFAAEMARPATTILPILEWVAHRDVDDREAGGVFSADGAIESEFRKFLEGGGNTGYTQMKDIEAFRKEADRLVNGRNPVGVVFSFLFKEVPAALNEFSELWTRFAVYRATKASLALENKTIRSIGRSAVDLKRTTEYSEEEIEAMALHDARNFTTNFNRRGAGGLIDFFNSMSMFANAAIQGASGVYRTFEQGEWQKGIRGSLSLMAIPALLGYLCTMLTPDDDDDEKQIPDYIRQNNLVFLDKRVPLSYELIPWYRIGVNYALMQQGRLSKTDGVENIALGFAEHALPAPPAIANTIKTGIDCFVPETDFYTENPSGMEMVMNVLLPEFSRGFIELEHGKSWTGSNLRYAYAGDKPQWMFQDYESELYKDISKMMYRIGKGDMENPSITINGRKMSDFKNVSPKEVHNFIGSITPNGWQKIACYAWGLGKEIKLRDGEDYIQRKDKPFVRDFTIEQNTDMFRIGVSREMSAMVKEANENFTRIEGLREMSDKDAKKRIKQWDKLYKDYTQMRLKGKDMTESNLNAYRRRLENTYKIHIDGNSVDALMHAYTMVMLQEEIEMKGLNRTIDDVERWRKKYENQPSYIR